MLSRNTKRFALSVLEGLGTPVALGIAMRLKYGEHDDLANLRIRPSDYLDTEPYLFGADYAAVNLLRKHPGLDTSVDRAEAARRGFFESERDCYRTNERLSPLLFDSRHYGQRVHEFLVCVRKWMRRLLGSMPPPSAGDGRFGPGSTLGNVGKLTTIPDKMTRAVDLTSGATGFLHLWHQTNWHQAALDQRRFDLNVVPGNRFTTVAKDATKDRGIAVEPSLNLFYQLGFGRAMKGSGCLGRFYDLGSMQEKHVQVARAASKSGLAETIDLKSASDTMSYNLVKLVTPPHWFANLDALRSPKTLVEGRWHRLEKFSSMGNGYTFELETCLFLSIACSAMEMGGMTPSPGVNVYVYGDDIIVPMGVSKLLLPALAFLGFTTNPRKTFLTGVFRESCGGDYFNGYRVTPYYMKSDVDQCPTEAIKAANALYSLCAGDGAPWSAYNLHRSWFLLLDLLPYSLKGLRGPRDLGDAVVHDSQDRWTVKIVDGVRYVRGIVPMPGQSVGWKHFHASVQLATALYGSVDDHPQGWSPGVTPRVNDDEPLGYRVKWLAYS